MGVQRAKEEPLPVCGVTLNGEVAAAFGVPAATISGQAFSCSGLTGTNLAGTSLSNSPVSPKPKWSGKRWAQIVPEITGGAGSIRGGFVGLTGGGAGDVLFQVNVDNAGNASLYLQDPPGSTVSTAALPSQSSYLLGVDGTTGDIFYYDEATEAEVNLSSVDPVASAFFSGSAAIALLGTCNGGSSLTASGTFQTSQAQFIGSVSGKDWCGNVIV